MRGNWITNADYGSVDPGLGGTGFAVHGGFFAAWKSVRERVISRVRALSRDNPSAPVVLTGHSLGGAMAVIAAWNLDFEGIKVDGLFTFGAPRAVNVEMAKAVSTCEGECSEWGAGNVPDIWRVTNEFDIVPRLPPSRQLDDTGSSLVWTSYVHVGHEVYYQKAAYQVCPDITPGTECKECANTWDLNNANTDRHSDYFQQPYPPPSTCSDYCKNLGLGSSGTIKGSAPFCVANGGKCDR